MDEITLIRNAVELCNARDVLQNEIQDYNKIINSYFPSVKEYKKHYFYNHAPRTFFAIAAIIIGLIIALPITAESGGGVGAIVALLLMFFVYNIIFKKLYIISSKKEFDKYERLLEQNAKERPVLQALMQSKIKELNQLEQRMLDDSVCIIPQNYWDHANYIYNLIQNKRAVDLVSAINIFEDVMHQLRMENMAQESLEYQQIAAYNSAIAATNSGISAYYSICNYYDNH